MKLWISLFAVFSLSLVTALGILFYRNLSPDLSGPVLSGVLAQKGLEVARGQGCVACHSLDGSKGIGPTWLGMYGSRARLSDGSEVLVNEDYIRESISNPAAKVVAGYDNLMVKYFLSEEDILALLEFTRQLGGSGRPR